MSVDATSKQNKIYKKFKLILSNTTFFKNKKKNSRKDVWKHDFSIKIFESKIIP